MNEFYLVLQRNGATPGKLGLIGVLALVLGGVIWFQLPASAPVSAEAESADTREPQGQFGTAEGSSAASNSPLAENRSELHWPEYPLQSLLEHDPFAHTAWSLPKPEISSSSLNPSADKTAKAVSPASGKVLRELQQQGASLVMVVNGQSVAAIGERHFRVGDTVDGYRITEIAKDGIVLEPL